MVGRIVANQEDEEYIELSLAVERAFKAMQDTNLALRTKAPDEWDAYWEAHLDYEQAKNDRAAHWRNKL